MNNGRYQILKRSMIAGVICLAFAVQGLAGLDEDRALLAAIEHKDQKTVLQAIKSGANVNANDEHGMSALMLAAEKGDIDLVKLLIQKGADIRYATQNNKTVLMFAAGSGNIDLVKYLISRGCDVTSEVLSSAVQSGNQGSIQFLLARSTDTKCLGDALVESSRMKNKDLINLFLSRGADINHVENKSHGTACVEDTALSVAVEHNDKLLAESLITRGANPNLPEGESCDPPLMRGQSDSSMVEFLLSKGADIRTACLPCAANASDLEMVKLLLRHGAFIDTPSKGTETALMLAAGNGNRPIVEYLIAQGADVNWSADGSPEYAPTALSMAKQNDHKEIVAILKNAGAKD